MKIYFYQLAFALASLLLGGCRNEGSALVKAPHPDSLKNAVVYKKMDNFFLNKNFQKVAYKFPLLRLPLNETDLASSFDTEAQELQVLDDTDLAFLFGKHNNNAATEQLSVDDLPTYFAVGRLHTTKWVGLIYRKNLADNEVFGLATYDSSGQKLSDFPLLGRQIESTYSETKQEMDIDTSCRITIFTEKSNYEPETQASKTVNSVENYFIDKKGVVQIVAQNK